MAIDGCKHDFLYLAKTILPRHMERLRTAMATPIPMETFATAKHGTKTCIKNLGRTVDFIGCYVFIENNGPIYVGISRTIVSRMKQHVTGHTHSDASLAYLMATRKKSHKMRRKIAMQDKDFRLAFMDAKAFIRTLSVAFIEIPCPVELYAFELYRSMEFDTHQWNTFKTH